MNEEIKIGSKADEQVTCSNCQKSMPLVGSRFVRTKNGKEIYLCVNCQELISKTLEQETVNPDIGRAAILGIAGGIVSGLLWYYIAVLIRYEIGYVALAAGYIIGMAVYLGSGKKRGPNFKL